MRIEAAGNRVGDSMCRAGAPGRWLGGVTIAVVSLVAAVVAGLRGLVTRPKDLPAAVAGGVIVVAGKVVALGQAVVGIHRRQRALDDAERLLLSSVFGSSVDLRAVRVQPGHAGVFSANARPFTLGATIYLKECQGPAILVHECAHVWQYQHLGSRYTFDALRAQHQLKERAYRWVDELGRGRQHWREFNREAQAQFLEDIVDHERGFFVDEGVRFRFKQVDYTDLARVTVAEIRAAGRTADR